MAFNRIQYHCKNFAFKKKPCIADRPVTGSFAAVTLRCDEGQGIWESAPGGRLRLHSQRTRIEVQRSRLGPPGDAELLMLRK